MSRYHGYLKTAATALTNYSGESPLSHYLKSFFALRKQMGSRDRRMVAGLCYAFFRLGRYCSQLPVEDRLLLAAHLPGIWPADALLAIAVDWRELQAAGVHLPEPARDADQLFAKRQWLSKGMEIGKLAAAMLQQPALFLRLRPGGEKAAEQWLQQRGIPFARLGNSCLQLPNGAQLTGFELNNWAVVQDASSQQTGHLLLRWLQKHQLLLPGRVWDCCAASGGKSIMLLDQVPQVSLTVSDIRPSILHNLQQRFAAAGLPRPASALLDLEQEPALPWKKPFDLVLADVPCSGSGTWARTPEQRTFFKEELLQVFHEKQYRIAACAGRALPPGGLLFYITCSVFAMENEAVVERLCNNGAFVPLEQQMIDGTGLAADSMFVALLQKQSA
ncbi:MAG: Fmu (Sun) domain-containing protein [Chitinophagaceae bacterium]|jgi:16S rRNA (cytosine967-C5)-methyltransferase|nr:Fmu (Sun) domain-containing protein [Chitinophagaceae bacterium]